MITEGVRTYLVRDATGAESVHVARSEWEAVERHVLHYGLLCLGEEPTVTEASSEVPCRDEVCGREVMS